MRVKFHCRLGLSVLLAIVSCAWPAKSFGQHYQSSVRADKTIVISPVPDVSGSQLIVFTSGSSAKTGKGAVYIDDSYEGGLDSEISLAPGNHKLEFFYPEGSQSLSTPVLRVSVRIQDQRLIVETAAFESSFPDCFPLQSPDAARSAAEAWSDTLQRIPTGEHPGVLNIPDPPSIGSSGCRFSLNIPKYRKLTVRSVPEGAEIYIDEEHLNRTNATLRVLSQTSCHLLIRKAGYRDVAQIVEFGDNDERTVEAKLASLSPHQARETTKHR